MTDLPLTPRCWSTEDVQPRDALANWCDSICQVMLELEIEAAGSDFFSAPLAEQLLRLLRDRYHEIGLTPAAVASDLGISGRYLHFLFAKRATTFGRELAAVRLERARNLLGDRRFAATPIGEVASRCGFSEASHFARRFRNSFGLSPSDYRRRSFRQNA